MRHFRAVLIIGIIEILIGAVTLLVTFASLLSGNNTKSFSVLVFVVIAACVSTSIGIGILKYKKLAYGLLLYFSSVVLFSKVMILLGVMQLNGALETTISPAIKTWTSILYHGVLILILTQKGFRKLFHIEI